LVATPNTGVEEFFTPGNPEGWLIRSGDRNVICEALIQAKQNPDKTFQKGVQAAARARSGFSWEDYGARVRKNFKKVLGR
jgi:glycosyltransferase involved in cell wall biosynthesis